MVIRNWTTWKLILFYHLIVKQISSRLESFIETKITFLPMSFFKEISKPIVISDLCLPIYIQLI